MPQFKFIVCETQERVMRYTVKARSRKEAEEKAWAGDTVDKFENEHEVTHREVLREDD